MSAGVAIPPQAAALVTEADSFRLKGDLVSAASAFERASSLLVAAKHDAATIASAFASLCRGRLSLLEAGGHAGAQVWFEEARKDFVSGQSLRASEAEGFLSVCQALGHLQDMDFDEAERCFRGAIGHFCGLAERFPKEAPYFRGLCQELMVEVAFADYLDDITDEDFDGARAPLAELRRQCAAIVQLHADSPWAAFFEAYGLFGEAVLPFTKAKIALSHYQVHEVKPHIELARPKIQRAADKLESSEPRPGKWIAMRALYKSMALHCEVVLSHVEALRTLLSGIRMGLPSLLRKVADQYDEVSQSYAEANVLGYAGLYSSAADRDLLRALADAVENEVDREFGEAPNFSKFTSNAELGSILLRDYVEVLSAYYGNAWKLVLIGAGSIIEALLLDRLQLKWTEVQVKCGLNAVSKDVVSNWELWEKIRNAERAGILSTGNRYLSDALRHYRNLVHPSRELRGEHVVDMPSALASLRAMHVIIQELRKGF